MTMADNPTTSTAAASPTPSGTMVGGRVNSASGVAGGGGMFLGEDAADALYNAHQMHQPSIAGPHNMAKLRRDSIAHSQGMGGVSWGSLTIGSWLRDEVMLHATLKNSRSNSTSKNATVHLHPSHRNSTSNSPPLVAQNSARRPSHFSAGSPPAAHNAYLPNLEKQYCKDYSCCGLSLPGLHDLLRHYEEAHIATSPGASIPATHSGYSASNNAAASQLKRKPQQNAQPRQPQHANYRNQSTQNQQQQHIIQQQPHQRHTPGANGPGQAMSQQRIPLSPATASTAQSNLSMGGISTHGGASSTGAAASNQAPPQLHLNGNLVDAVSTNEVFLQANNSHLPISHNPHMLRRPDQTAAMPNSNAAAQHGKIPITPQHSFNAYSLNVATSKGGQASNRTNNMTLHNTVPNNNMNNMNKFQKFPNNMHAAMELDFMDEDLIGGDVEDPAFMRLGNTLTHTADNSFAAHTAMNAARFNTMSMPTVGHPTPPPSTTTGTVPPHVIHDEEDDDDDDDDEDDDDDDDEGLAVHNTVNTKAKSSHRNNHRQEGYIDDPARRLYVMDHEEHKPFKCPVIGCDKTYKNQNGLKYHKQHGHQNQKLHENPDGTYSIIDPESNEPYPDGMGYEKDKPYRCEVCGKRYKNLNGLKYHRGHSTH